MADLDGDGALEIVVGTSFDGHAHRGTVYVLDLAGELRWSYDTGAPTIYGLEGTLKVRVLRIFDVDEDGQLEIITASVHDPLFPSRICILNYDGVLEGDYWHPGHVIDLDVGKLGNGGRIGFLAVSNTPEWNQAVVAGCLPGKDIHGQAPPGPVQGVPQWEGLWYRGFAAGQLNTARRDLRLVIADGTIAVGLQNGQLLGHLDVETGDFQPGEEGTLPPLAHPDVTVAREEIEPRGKRWALLIGINYGYDGPLTPLKFAVRDAETLAKCLSEQGYQVKTLTETAATREVIESDLQKWLIQNVKPLDRVVIFFSGHGFVKNKKSYLLPYGVKDKNAEESLSVEALKKEVDNLDAQEIVLLLDHCHGENR
ncbi:MAG: caspase family protein, partial [Deltaproteobacteria bacterium]|nr:caspase family protein [Deltaproteobacteria bacterium]